MDDVSPVTVNIPTVNVPQVTAIQIEIPKVDYYKRTDFIESINKIILIDDYELAKLGITKNVWKGRKETDEHRKHIREGQLKRIANICDLNGDIARLYPTFSTKGCEYMN